ncbi:MAG: DNA gyrase subunit A, partial [Miltoncostaeaceae bacterium]
MAIDRDGRIELRELGEEMSSSYLDYAMSVIVGRALPDVRDGLKPVHRRVLFAMHDRGNLPDRPYVKSANIVGAVMGEYHPHGDSAIYDTLVRLAQDFASRYPLVDGQGNFGSSEFAAAAMRYTEARLSPIATEMLRDIDEETVDDAPTYDDRRTEPTVLPARIPNLLVNGSSGIAVGMATNIPPHNLRESIDAVVATIDEPEISSEDLMKHLHGPDFPTGGIIVGRQGILDAYRSGRGRVVVRGRAHNEPLRTGRNAIVFTELPYQVNKAELVKKMAELAQEKVIPEIADLRDESGRDGLRVVIELRRDAVPAVALNKIYKHTQAQTTFGVNCIALVDGVPRTLGLRELIQHYVAHQKEVITRRSRFRLARAEARAHILEGLLKALDRIDEVIELIRGAADPDEARQELIARLELTEVQARAILDLRLQRLTQLEAGKIEAEHAELLGVISELRSILGDEALVYGLVRSELLESKEKYGDERRTEIVPGEGDLDLEDLIAEEEMVISLTAGGYIKRLPVATYRAQRRGGKGLRGVRLKDDDYIEQLFIASTHHFLLFFTNHGKVYRQKVHELPKGARDSRGRHIANVLALQPDEEVRAVFATRDYTEGKYLVLGTTNGMIKKTELKSYDTILRETGLIAVRLDEGDELVNAVLTDGEEDLLVVSALGQAARFSEGQVRPMGRDTRGVMGMRFRVGDELLAMSVVPAGLDEDETFVFTVTDGGFAKRTPLSDYRSQGRGGLGLKAARRTEDRGGLVAALAVAEQDEVVSIRAEGGVTRSPVADVRATGRDTMGVTFVDVGSDDAVVAISRVVEDDLDAPD